MNGQRFPYEGTIKLLYAFQAQTGLPTCQRALKTALFINQTMVQDYKSGMKYAVSDRAESRIDLPEIYRSHAENNHANLKNRDIYLPLSGIDDMAMAEIQGYFKDNFVEIMRPRPRALSDAETLTTLISVAQVMCQHFGSSEDGGLHIPAVYPGDIYQVRHRHIHFKLD